MAYRVLARAYRSNTFDEVVGQDAIATTLKNAIKSGRIHHGYLFTGTRGVGKTSMARILAKALNCLAFDAPTPTPCCQCESCKATASGEDIDVVEIDAASNTGVDDIRELRGNATLRPARSRYKVYIIDEVHMLSTSAFNALLKTLEEPPPHVKFILATTEPQKVPATIQSRCQRFDFRAIDSASIAGHLRRILDAEGIKADEAVLRRAARLANGSMRDALSLLDMLLSYEPTEVTAAVLNELVPPPHDELASAVIECVAERDAAGALRALDRAMQTGRTVDRFCDHLIEYLRTLMLMRVCGEDTDLIDAADSERAALVSQASKFDAPTYVYMISLLEELRRHLKSSGAGRALADAAIVRLAMSQQFTEITELMARLGDQAAPSPPTGASKPPASKKNEMTDRPAAPATPTTRPAGPVTAAVTGTAPASPRSARAGHGSGDPSGAGATIPVPPARVTTTEWERVARDPLVVRVKEAVEGTLMDIRPTGNRAAAGPDLKDPGEIPVAESTQEA